jgi:uncharacterized Rmd1/YagE family protein
MTDEKRIIKKIMKWLKEQQKWKNWMILSLIFISAFLGMMAKSCPICNCSYENEQIKMLKAQNVVCQGGFEDGIKAIILNHGGIIIWGIVIGWVLHGVGFNLIGRLN